MIVLMLLEMVNFFGKVYGGVILCLFDQVVYVCVSCYVGSYVVILLVDQVMFCQFIVVGELVIFLVLVNYIGILLMEIGIKVVVEDIFKCSVCYVNSCFFMMVVVDEEGWLMFVLFLQLVMFDEKCCQVVVQICCQLCQEMEQCYLELLVLNLLLLEE